ncbi:MAG: hypothetical protein ACLQVI_39220 [Polyangiaceae bacterium]
MSVRAQLAPASFLLLASLPLACAGGHGASDVGSTAAALTGAQSEQRGFHFKSYVYVPTSAAPTDITAAIAMQIKTGLGALQVPEIIFNDLDASNLDPTTFTYTTVNVVDPTNATPPTTIQRVDYAYNDVADVTDTLSKTSSVNFTLLFGNYIPDLTTLLADCSDDPTTDADSFWYGYEPTLPACTTLINNELSTIQTEEQQLAALGDGPTTIGPHEAGRWFIPLTATLDPPNLPGKQYYPEYDRLYGVAPSSAPGKTQLLVYDFHGVDSDETNPDDILGQEAIKTLRTMLTAQPNFRPVNTNPFAMLEDISVNGQALQNVTYADMFSWIVDKANYPSEVGTDPAAILALRQQAMAKFTERWIYWDLPLSVSDANGKMTTITVEVRFFYGYEVGSPAIQQQAEWRYLEAFWYGDVFLYTGHSHFGNGPLEPTNYQSDNFNSNYQIMLINSCISYNYYDQNFIDMKPGGSQNLDMVVNGLPAYVQDMGIATGRFLAGLIDGKQHTYLDLLTMMELDEPWSPDYDPMRVVNGELDNVFSEAATPIAVTVLPPVYP